MSDVVQARYGASYRETIVIFREGWQAAVRLFRPSGYSVRQDGSYIVDDCTGFVFGMCGDVHLQIAVPREIFEEYESKHVGPCRKIRESYIPAAVLDALPKPKVMAHYYDSCPRLSRQDLRRRVRDIEKNPARHVTGMIGAFVREEVESEAKKFRQIIALFDEIGWTMPTRDYTLAEKE